MSSSILTLGELDPNDCSRAPHYERLQADDIAYLGEQFDTANNAEWLSVQEDSIAIWNHLVEGKDDDGRIVPARIPALRAVLTEMRLIRGYRAEPRSCSSRFAWAADV